MPKDMEDIADIWYNPCREKERTQWGSHVQDMVARNREKDTKLLFSGFGECVPIKKGRGGTFDFKIDGSKILVEVTTINLPVGKSPSNDVPYLERAIAKAVKHVAEKDSSDFPRYARGGAADCTVMCELTDMWEVLESGGARIVSRHGLDYMVFVPAEPSEHQPTRATRPWPSSGLACSGCSQGACPASTAQSGCDHAGRRSELAVWRPAQARPRPEQIPLAAEALSAARRAQAAIQKFGQGETGAVRIFLERSSGPFERSDDLCFMPKLFKSI